MLTSPCAHHTGCCCNRSTGGNISLYAGNQLLAPLNCIQWSAQGGDARSIQVGTSAPDPLPFNADLSAKALLDHLQGTTLLAADVLTKGVCGGVQDCACICVFCVCIDMTFFKDSVRAGVGGITKTSLSP